MVPKNYNLLRSPQRNESEPLEVKLFVKVLSILQVSEAEQSYTIDIIYRLSWIDYRLRLSSNYVESLPLVLDMSWNKKIWVPDVYIRNSLKLTTLDGTMAPLTYLEVDEGNRVSHTARMTIKMICDMHLFAYPHDTQSCFLDSKSRE